MPEDFHSRSFRSGFVPSAARTGHTETFDITLQKSRGARFYFDITAFTGTSITFSLFAVDPVTGTEYAAASLASAAKSATGAFMLTIAPGVTTVANLALADVAPRKIRLKTSGTITSVTWQCSVELFD